jgi:hypothetical protein
MWLVLSVLNRRFELVDKLPNGIDGILEYLGEMAAGYRNHPKWNEVAMLKADLMNVRQRWTGVSVQQIADRCLELGMRAEDVREIKQLVTKAQAGARLVPQKSYRDHRFKPYMDSPTSATLNTSRAW